MIENVLNWIEKGRLIIGLGLVASIAIGAFILFFPGFHHPVKTDDSAKVAQLEQTVSQLTDRVNELSRDQAATGTSGTVTGVSNADSNSQASTPATTGTMVNLNTASAQELDSLPGIGPTYAQRIIDYRQQHNGFKSITEIKNIKGIGDKTFDKLKDRISIGRS
jgi:comEA protein